MKDLLGVQKSTLEVKEIPEEEIEFEMPKASEKLDEFYKTYEEENTRRTGVHHPSEISGVMCPRKYVLSEMFPEEIDGKINPHLRKIFNVGHALHDVMQEMYAEAGMMYGRYTCSRACIGCPINGRYHGFKPEKDICRGYAPLGVKPIWKYSEVTIDNREFNIHGHTDGILVIEGRKYIYEFKTINDRGYKSLNVPIKEHIEQAMIYLYCEMESSKERYRKALEKKEKHDKGIEKLHPIKLQEVEEQLEIEGLDYEGIIIQYMSKDRQLIKEYFIQNNPKRLREFIEDKGKYLLYADKCLEERTLPEKICQNKTEGKRKHFCKVADKCFEL